MSRRGVVAALAVMVGILLLELQPALGQAATGLSRVFRVVSAKRCERFVDPVSRTEVTPEKSEDVVMVIELGGISVEDFQATGTDEVFVESGGSRFKPSAMSSGDWRNPDGTTEEERTIVVVVPRPPVAFSLYFGKRPVVAFKAETSVAAVLP
jgi:hypothetical protein